MVAFSFTRIVKSPLRSVTVPFFVPFSKTEAPITGCSPLADTTLPFTSLFCPHATAQKKNIKRNNSLLFILLVSFLVILFLFEFVVLSPTSPFLVVEVREFLYLKGFES